MHAKEIMTRYVEAMLAGDRATALALLADDVVLHVPGRGAMAGARRGRDAVVEYFRTAIDHAPRGVELEIIDMLASEERVALLVRERLLGEDAVLDIRRVNVYRVHDGEIVEVWIFEADQYAVDEFLTGVREPTAAVH